MLSADSILGRNFAIMAAGLDGLAKRQQVHAANLGNVDTEGYHARTLDFESVLKHAISSGTAGSGPLGADGGYGPTGAGDAVTSAGLVSQFAESERPGMRPVDRTTEVSEMMNDNIQFRVLTQQVNNRITSLKNVLSEMGRA